VAAYAALKRRVAAGAAGDRIAYAAGKAAFVDALERRALRNSRDAIVTDSAAPQT
jgi:GrpB-like predicted nucleotidyltransferase (UPF0157 family)